MPSRRCSREVGQRLVEEERLRLPHDRPPHRDPLALATGEVGGLALQVLVQLQDVGRLVDPPPHLGVVHLGQPERERDVLEDAEVRVQRVVLEHHRQVALARRLVVDPGSSDDHVAAGDVLQPDDHAEQGRLPAAGRADEDHELAVVDVQADVVHRGEAVAVLLDDVAHLDRGHELVPFWKCRRSGISP
jgi:hypothetical protein